MLQWGHLANHWAAVPSALTAAAWQRCPMKCENMCLYSGCGVWERPGFSCQWGTAAMSSSHRHHPATLQYATWNKRSLCVCVRPLTVTKTRAGTSRCTFHSKHTVSGSLRANTSTLWAQAERGEMSLTWISTVSTRCCYLCWGQTHCKHTVWISMTSVRDSAFPGWSDSNFTGNKGGGKHCHTNWTFHTSFHLNVKLSKYETYKLPQNN